MRPSHAASRQNVVASDLSIVIRHHNDGHVVRQNINGVVPWDSDGNLELPRKKLSAVERFRGALEVGPKPVEGSVRGHLRVLPLRSQKLLPVQPHVVVGATLRGQQVGYVHSKLLAVLVVLPILVRVWRRENVSVDVAAGTQSASHALDNRAEHGLEVVLEHTVQLVRLPRGQPQGPVAKVRGEVVHGEVKLVRDEPSRLPGSQHELVSLSYNQTSRFSVVLHITSVKLNELHRVVAHVWFIVDEVFEKRVA
mmetsp:Transcript_6948/g.12754  ORF Transcript_6948/g.12754 Transcript_6948/m.12754 type:complete len:252 (+) Transcript_6948:1182-1937(+)